MKKYLIYISLIALGILAGWILFGLIGLGERHIEDQHNHTEETAQIWTCSMHPQIRQSEPGDCPICGMDLIPLEESDNSNPLVFSMSDEAVKISNIQTSIVGSNITADDHNGLSFSGRIEADETMSSSIVTYVEGRIEQLYITYTGQKVSQGQSVAVIYSPQLISAQKELLEAYKTKDMSPKLYVASYNKLKNWKLTDGQIQSILDSENIIETFTIYAQHSGVISQKKVSVGDYLKSGQSLFEVQSLSQVWAVFDVYESDVPKIDIGDKISFKTASYPNELFTAKVNFIDPLIDPATRTNAVRATISNSNGKLKPDMFIEGSVVAAIGNNTTLFVPKSAVLWTGKRSVVYVKVPNESIPSFEYREVELGASSGNFYELLSGLQNGEEVVTNGAFVIDASAQLNNQASMMNQQLVTHENADEKTTAKDYQSATPEAFKIQLNTVVTNYIKVKEALAKDDPKTAKEEASQLQAQIEKVNTSFLSGPAHQYWMDLQNKMLSTSKEIANTDHIEDQRESFIVLSDALLDAIKTFGTITSYYEQYCPMANNNNGAYWLSDTPKVLNPYFGLSMLGCGEITKEWK